MNYSRACIIDANALDNLLTKLIQDERTNYDNTIDANFVVKDFYKNYILDENKFLYTCKDDDVIIAYIYVYLDNSLAVIDALYVSDNYRNKGIATKLIEYALSWINDKKCKSIDVSVINANISAKKLYEKFGFKTYKEVKRLEL